MTRPTPIQFGGPAHAAAARDVAMGPVERGEAAHRAGVRGTRPRTGSGDHASAPVCKLAVVGLQLGSIDTAVLPALARLVAEHRPDRLLVLVGPSQRKTRRNAGCTVSDSVGPVLAVLRDTHPGPVNLQIPAAAYKCRNSTRPNLRGTQLLPPSFEITPGWVSTTASPTTGGAYPGLAAMDLARKTGSCVILGGTHLPGMIGEVTAAADGTRRTLWGLEVISLPVELPHRGRQQPTAGLGILTTNPTGPATPTLISIPTATPHLGATGRTGPRAAVEQSSNHHNQRLRDHG